MTWPAMHARLASGATASCSYASPGRRCPRRSVRPIHCTAGPLLTRTAVVSPLRSAALDSQPRSTAPPPHLGPTQMIAQSQGVSASEDDLDSRNLSSEQIESQQELEEEEDLPMVQLNLPTPTFTKVRKAEYMQSCVTYQDCPPPNFPEFAVIGRSNVGKSSLINMLTSSRRLALVSKEPGKTKCINHFNINDNWYLVDLPGYGYARLGLDSRSNFDKFTKEYFTHRPNLAMVFLLVDSSIKPMKIDLQYANWLTDNEVPFALVFTKADKRKKGGVKCSDNIRAFKKALLQDFALLPPCVVTSSETGIGKTELQHFIASLRTAFEGSGQLARAKLAGRRQNNAAVVRGDNQSLETVRHSS